MKYVLSWLLCYLILKLYGKIVCCVCFWRWMILLVNCILLVSCCCGVRSCGEFVWSFWIWFLELMFKVCCRLGCLVICKFIYCFGELVDVGKLSFCFCNDNYVWVLEILLLCWLGEDVRVCGFVWEREGWSCESMCNERVLFLFIIDFNR